MKKSKKTPYIQHDWEKMAKKAMKVKDGPFQQYLWNTKFDSPVNYGQAYQQFLLTQKS